MMKVDKLKKGNFMATISGGVRNGMFAAYGYGDSPQEAKKEARGKFVQLKKCISEEQDKESREN